MARIGERQKQLHRKSAGLVFEFRVLWWLQQGNRRLNGADEASEWPAAIFMMRRMITQGGSDANWS